MRGGSELVERERGWGDEVTSSCTLRTYANFIASSDSEWKRYSEDKCVPWERTDKVCGCCCPCTVPECTWSIFDYPIFQDW